MSFRFLLVIAILLACMAVVALVFSTFFLKEALGLDELVHHFQNIDGLVSCHRYTALFLAVAALAVELLRRLLVCQAGAQQATEPSYHAAPVSDRDYVPAEGRPTAPLKKGCDGDGISVKADPEPVDSHPLTVMVAQDSDSRGLTDNTHSDGRRQRHCYAVGYAMSIAMFFLLASFLIWLFFMTGIFWSYSMFNWEHGTEEQLKRTWNSVAGCTSSPTCAQPVCDFMETYHCSGGTRLCPYDNVILPTPDTRDNEGACPVCDFTTRRSPLVVTGRCNALIMRRASYDGLLYLLLSWSAALMLAIVCVWLLVRLACGCLRAIFHA